MSSIPLLLLKPKKLSFLPGIAARIALSMPGLKYDLEQADSPYKPNQYAQLALLNAAVFGLLFGIILIPALLNRGMEPPLAVARGLAIGLAIMLLWMVLLMMYPRIIAGKKAENVDNNLIFALKDLHLQVSAGVNLYHAMVNVATTDYGSVSEQFSEAIKRIETGTPMEKALEMIAAQSKSHFMQKTIWQMVNALRAGASLKDTLQSLINDLKSEQYAKIREYGQELNMLILLYLLFAIAVPSIGSTLLIVLSGFGGGGISESTFISFGLISMVVQVIMITFIKSRRPAVSF